MDNRDLIKISLADASELIQKKEISPVELTEAYLDRIEKTEGKINSYISVYKESARKVAKGLEDMQMAGHFLGPLHGIPVALKDNISLKGLATTAGSKILADNIPDADAPVARRLKSAGAVILGKTNMHELAWGAITDNPHYGASRNPWDPTRYVAGSSGGSGASVANGTSLVALGTDTGGSVRLPSAINGTVGMRPTLGRVSIEGIIPLAWTLDTCGPLTRTVKDNAIMMNVMAGFERTDPSTSSETACDYTADLNIGAKNLRIGIIPDILFKDDQPDVIKAVQGAMDAFKAMGAKIVEFSSEHLGFETTTMATNIITAVESSTWHQKLIRERPEDYGLDCRSLIEAGEFLTGTNYANAQRYRRVLMDDFKAAFKEIDFFLMPTIPFTALPLGNYELVINGEQKNFLDLTLTYSCIPSLCGLPAMSLPCGLDHNGLPIGLQLMGRPFDEVTLYRAGAAFERVFNIYDKLPAFR